MIRSLIFLLISCQATSAIANGSFVAVSAGGSELSDGTYTFSVMGGMLPVITEGNTSAGLALRYTRWSRHSPIDLGESRSIALNSLNVGAFNLALIAEYRVAPALALGFNIDLVGISHGRDTSLTGAVSANAKPAALNLLLGGKSDRGSLNSEFYGAYFLGSVRLATGLSHQVIEFTANDVSTEKLQRFFDLLFIRADYFF